MILGVDPGLKGALAFFDPLNGGVEIFDMPVMTVKRNGKDKNRVDKYALSMLIDAKSPDTKVAVFEDVWGVEGQAGASQFEFGKATGIAEGAVAANYIKIVHVAPSRWKRCMGVTSDKNSSRAKASHMAPAYSHLWPLVKHDGRAEALLIAMYYNLWGDNA